MTIVYLGITGTIVIDKRGERMSEFLLHDLDPDNKEFEAVISSKIQYNNSTILKYNATTRPIYWYKDRTGYLPDSPKCGYNGAKCPAKGFKQTS